MVLIPEGSFTMGSDIGPTDEKPKHEVFVKSFFIDLLPITNAEFAEFLNSQGLRNLRGEACVLADWRVRSDSRQRDTDGQQGEVMKALCSYCAKTHG